MPVPIERLTPHMAAGNWQHRMYPQGEGPPAPAGGRVAAG